jgi:hypothetical protein
VLGSAHLERCGQQRLFFLQSVLTTLAAAVMKISHSIVAVCRQRGAKPTGWPRLRRIRIRRPEILQL